MLYDLTGQLVSEQLFTIADAGNIVGSRSVASDNKEKTWE